MFVYDSSHNSYFGKCFFIYSSGWFDVSNCSWFNTWATFRHYVLFHLLHFRLIIGSNKPLVLRKGIFIIIILDSVSVGCIPKIKFRQHFGPIRINYRSQYFDCSNHRILRWQTIYQNRRNRDNSRLGFEEMWRFESNILNSCLAIATNRWNGQPELVMR